MFFIDTDGLIKSITEKTTTNGDEELFLKHLYRRKAQEMSLKTGQSIFYGIAYRNKALDLEKAEFFCVPIDRKAYWELLEYTARPNISVYITDFDGEWRLEEQPEYIDDFDGREFEQFCAMLLESNGYSDVVVTPYTGDYGVDVLAYKDRKKYGIQCKRNKSKVQINAIQEAYAGAKFYDCDIPVVMTNNFFTDASKELAEKIGVVLWDRDIVINMY